ncbi:hypothetical protein ALC57_08544 [Trachymyrmex cornetzi]|uniref:Helix-turn-helix domain-containing protein n=1 Tax=Trachymyrmex cornetzi TaxID=471704 RepID=A0A151J7B5_9HYME|nr:hypothetical protein ALC57_08544 [Trachymyrmex cornetzi]
MVPYSMVRRLITEAVIEEDDDAIVYVKGHEKRMWLWNLLLDDERERMNIVTLDAVYEDMESLTYLDDSPNIDENNKSHSYQKPTFSGRCLNFLSQHSISQKKGIIFNFVDKVFYLSHPEFHKKNLDFIVKLLMDNDYPLDFVLKTMNMRIKKIINNFNVTNNKKSNIDVIKGKIKWFSIPYIEGISNKFKNFINGMVHKVSFFSVNKLNKFIRVHKDSLPIESIRNVVYRINCCDCDASYVGQTGRKLKTRISEHRKHINSTTSSKSVITDHRLQCEHDFDWENVEVLDTEGFYNKRLVSEMIHIKRQKKWAEFAKRYRSFKSGLHGVN